MRSTVPPHQPAGSEEADGDGESEPGVPCFCWWRSLPEYEAAAAIETPKAAARTATARIRVVREMERLAAAAASDSIDELRHRLLAYKAGDLWFPAGGIAKQDTDIPSVITLLLLGFAGVGKSSLVNLMYSVLGRSGFVPFAHTASPAGKEGRTVILEEHNVLRSMKNGFCVFDSPGLDYDRISEGFDEVSHWVEDGVRHRQLCHLSSSSSSSSSFASFASTSASTSSAAAANRFMRRRVNCGVVVASLSELHSSLVSGHLQHLDATRQLFHHPSPCSLDFACMPLHLAILYHSVSLSVTAYHDDAPILILTHGDELTEEERIDTRVALCDYLGVTETAGVYDVPCLNEHGVHVDEFDPVTAYAIAEAVYRALVVADRCHPPKPGLKDWLLVALSWAMCALSAFFAFLSCCCSKLAKFNRDHHKMR